ncbi:MAG TPA: hypothetical protein VFW71_15185 [Actinomycetota bacterium]|nr:hypothetical protein [Actinomycetota bacterium]
MTDATTHGLFRRLRQAISRTPLLPVWPDPSGAPSPKPFLRSPWGYDALRSALGLDVTTVPPTVTAASGTLRASAGQAPWFRPEHIVEPVWYAED